MGQPKPSAGFCVFAKRAFLQQAARRPIDSDHQYKIDIIGDDLMPYAMRRTGDLIRSFYSQVDTTDPNVSMTNPASEDVGNPTIRNDLNPFNLTASASDPESGILKNGYQFSWSYWDSSSGSWTAWQDVNPCQRTRLSRLRPRAVKATTVSMSGAKTAAEANPSRR